MDPQSHIYNSTSRLRWRRVVDLAGSVIAFSSRAIASLRGGSTSMPPNPEAVTFPSERADRLSRRAPDAPLLVRKYETRVKVEGSLLHASGLDALAQILDAHPRRTETSIVPTAPHMLGEFDLGLSVSRGQTHCFPELAGVWFSQGNVRGKVDLSSTPKRGWFEVYATKAA